MLIESIEVLEDARPGALGKCPCCGEIRLALGETVLFLSCSRTFLAGRRAFFSCPVTFWAGRRTLFGCSVTFWAGRRTLFGCSVTFLTGRRTLLGCPVTFLAGRRTLFGCSRTSLTGRKELLGGKGSVWKCMICLLSQFRTLSEHDANIFCWCGVLKDDARKASLSARNGYSAARRFLDYAEMSSVVSGQLTNPASKEALYLGPTVSVTVPLSSRTVTLFSDIR